MLFFDAPNFYLDGEFIHEQRLICDRPNMNQISTAFIPNSALYEPDLNHIRGEIILAVFCEDGIVFISVLPESLYDKKRD